MAVSTSDPSVQMHDADQLANILLPEDERQKLKLQDEKVIEDGIDLDMNKLKEMILQLKQSVSTLTSKQVKIENEWEDLSDKFEKIADRIELDRKKNLKHHEAINFARLKVIEEQQKALRAFRLSSVKEIIRIFLQPRIGRLQQYNGRKFDIPKWYHKKPVLKTFPTISIVSPSYNQADFLEKTILSIINQKYPALEYVIQDGGSKDASVQVIERYKSSLKHWESKKDNGQSHAINLGFQHTTGEIMAYLNSDDILMPGTLHYVANYFNKHPDVDVVYGHRIIIDEYDQEIGKWVLPHHNDEILTWADFIPQETLFWRRRIWDKVGGNIDETFKFAMDWDLLLRFKEANAVFKRLPRFMGAFRVHTNQKTSAQMSDVGEREMERLRKRCHQRRVSPQEIRRNIRAYQLWNIFYHKLYAVGILRY